MRRDQHLLAPVATILSGAVLLASGCSSSRPDEGWKAQKAYGAQMAQKGFWREALFRFQHAADQQPDDPQIQNDLAVAYESVGETARALAAYKRALELAPNDQKIKRNYARFAEYYTSVQRAAAAPAPSAPTPSPSPTPAPPSGPVTAAPAPTPVVPPPSLPTPVIAPGPPK